MVSTPAQGKRKRHNNCFPVNIYILVLDKNYKNQYSVKIWTILRLKLQSGGAWLSKRLFIEKLYHEPQLFLCVHTFSLPVL